MISTLALRAFVSAQSRWLATCVAFDARTAQSRRRDEGLTTLEIVIWGLGLFLAAGGAVFVITNAITSRTSLIQ